MGETQNLRVVRVDKYDALLARYMRDVKCTDIVVVGNKGTPTTTADWIIGTETVDADTQLFPYLFTVHSTNTAAQFIVHVGTSTVSSLQVDSTANQTLQAPGCDCPIFRVPAGETVKVTVTGITSTADEYAAFLYCKREPLLTVAEN